MKSRVALVLAVAVLAGGASFAFAAGPSITGGVVASGVLTDKNTTVSLSRTSGFVMEWAKVPPGASFGWHSTVARSPSRSPPAR